MKTPEPHDSISRNELRDLAAGEADVCVSLYMPTHPSAPQAHQDPVRLRNLLDEAEARLLQRGQSRSEAEELLKPVRDMVPDELFWTEQSDGLAVFLTRDSMRRFRLPAPFEQSIEVARQFLITPIISMLRPGHAFYILAASQNSCRLLRGTQFHVEELEIEDLPPALGTALESCRERSLPWHHQRQNESATVGVQDFEDRVKSLDLPGCFRQLADPLRTMLHNHSAPLVFAGVEESFSNFRELFGKIGLISKRIAGNPEKLSAEQLHQKAWPIVEKHLLHEAARIWDNYHLAHNQNRATNALSVILTACRDGLVETLLIADGTRHLGTIDPQTSRIRMDGDPAKIVDLLNLAAVMGLRTGAAIIAVPPTSIPEKASAAAILRSPLSAIEVSETDS